MKRFHLPKGRDEIWVRSYGSYTAKNSIQEYCFFANISTMRFRNFWVPGHQALDPSVEVYSVVGAPGSQL